MLNVEICYAPNHKVGLSVMRRADRAFFDFTAASFAAPGVVPAALTTPMTESPGLFVGVYTLNYGPTPGALWWDGDMIVGIHDFGPIGATDAAGKPFAPICQVRFAVPFARGNSLYVPPPLFYY